MQRKGKESSDDNDKMAKQENKFGLTFGVKAFLGLCVLGIGGGIFTGYFRSVAETSKWAPKEQKMYYQNIENQYNKLFENADNFEDSLKVYQENGLISLEEPSFEEKERIFK